MKPNIIMVLADQHPASLMGCAAHRQAITPNMDRLAAGGVRFQNAYCQNPICTPSRVSILSGQYCHNHGIYGLSGPVPQGLPNLLGQARSAGYRTAAFGKLHLPNRPRNWIAGDVDLFADSYETIDGAVGKSPFLEKLERNGLRELEDSWHNKWNYGLSPISLDATPSLLPLDETQEVWCAREAMRFVEQSVNQPFCIQVAFQRPHHPLLPNRKFWDLYPEELDLPETFDPEPVHRPPHFLAMWQQLRAMTWDFAETKDEPFIKGAQRAWRGTLACVSQIDYVLGLLLDFLDDQDLSDNTIIVYGSDHGAYHTMHGLPEKAPGICGDVVCRVPMIWRGPGIERSGRSRSTLVENIDITPTLLSLCGIPPLPTADGKDMSALLGGSDEIPDQIAVTENPWSKAIRWNEWRLVHYQPEMFPGQNIGELYNLHQDPGERQNLYDFPESASTVAQGRKLLLEWLIRTTRVVTTHPAVKIIPEAGDAEGSQIYLLAGDGRAPNEIQPRFRKDNQVDYL